MKTIELKSFSMRENSLVRKLILYGILTERKVVSKANPKVVALSKYTLKVIFDSFVSIFYAALGFGLLALFWSAISYITKGELPGPVATLAVLWEMILNPIYDNGPNDKGIAIQLWASVVRVLYGFGLGSLIAIPVGILIGSSDVLRKILYPIIQILKPVSPLAWFPLGLVAFKSSPSATIFIIFITSIWPTLINTSFGVASIPDDHKNVAKAFGFSKTKYLFKIVVPFAMPHIITGLRLSIGVAWLVIVAGEMLSGGTGIGFFVWDSWNALSLEKVISAILIIGTVGLLFDRLFTFIEKLVTYGK
jgi:nitrate/nitrite transport system permease protein